MKQGAYVVLTEPVIVIGSLGSEYLLKGTKGMVLEERGGLVMVEIADSRYEVPYASVKSSEAAA